MFSKISALIVIAFFIYYIDKQIKKERIEITRIKNLTLNDLSLFGLGIIFIIGFFWIFYSIFI